MKKIKTAITIFAAAAIGLACVASAHAAEESIDFSMTAEPNSGPLYREVHRPLDASLTVTVSNPPSETKITPLKVANVSFPGDMEFFPDEKLTPACPESKLNEQSNLSAGVAAIVALCPRSVIGTGTAVVQIGQSKGPEPLPTVTDPKLVIFNAGRNSAGRPRIVIYGYSKIVNAGLLMRGTLAVNRELKIEIGVLPYDSSVSRFTLGIPGTPIEIDEGSGDGPMTVKGRDQAYLRGKCSTGTWTAFGSFVLGTRESPSGIPISDDTFVDSNSFELPCEGRVGKARTVIGKIKGPRKIAPGAKARFEVLITNKGTATARNLRLTAGGVARGSGSLDSLKPGQSRKVVVAVRARSGKKSGRLTFRLSTNGKYQGKSARILKIG